ncbi:MAG: histidine kinase [Bacteroidota bacterium]
MRIGQLNRDFDISDIQKDKFHHHVIFWLVYFTMNLFRWGYYYDDYWYSLKSNLVEFPIYIVLVYFNLYVLLKRYVPGKIYTYISILFVCILAASLLKIILIYEFVTTEIFKESTLRLEGLFNLKYVIAVFIGELYVVGVTMAIKLTIDWVRSEKKTRELEQRNLKTELSMLRAKMQPHFFFNTLNNLYSLTLDKSDQAPETVLKLSELMSYVVYEGKNSRVILIKEIEHIQNYLNLERLRYDDRLNVTFDINGEIAGKEIPPLILITFVENAFKHGSSDTLGKISIVILLKVKDGRVFFEVTNDFRPKAAMKNPKKGVGIENTRRRLDLLYGDAYSLDTQQKDGKFSVKLSIPTL